MFYDATNGFGDAFPRQIKEPTFSYINFFKMLLNISYFSLLMHVKSDVRTRYLLETTEFLGFFKKTRALWQCLSSALPFCLPVA